MQHHRPLRRGRARLAATVLALLALAGCGPDEDRVQVLAASSLGPVLEQLAEAAPVGFDVSLAGSQVLESQVRAGAPVDLVLLADPERAEALADDRLAAQAVPLAGNALAVLVRDVSIVPDLTALTDRSLRVVLADAGVPLGDQTRAALQRLEEDGRLSEGGAEAILAGADSLEDSAASVVAKVTAGEADAAIVYSTDAARAEGLVAFPIPRSDIRPAYTAQLVGDHPHAAELVEWLRSDEARDIWRAAGFIVDADDAATRS